MSTSSKAQLRGDTRRMLRVDRTSGEARPAPPTLAPATEACDDGAAAVASLWREGRAAARSRLEAVAS